VLGHWHGRGLAPLRYGYGIRCSHDRDRGHRRCQTVAGPVNAPDPQPADNATVKSSAPAMFDAGYFPRTRRRMNEQF
jgi:hypothetical protein